MSGVQKQIAFTRLWNKLPPLEPGVSGREILELLYGALWHLELAAEIGGGFSTDTMEKLHEGNPTPWQEWLNQKPTLSVQSDGNELGMHYSFRTSFDPRLKGLVQTMQLADAALRLAGARDILKFNPKFKGKITPRPYVLGKFTKILDTDGNFIKPFSHFNSKKQKLKNVLIVIAFRDSIMHGEEYSGKEDKCRKFRKLWIDGKLKRKRPKYSPAVIAEACREVWVELVDCVKHL